MVLKNLTPSFVLLFLLLKPLKVFAIDFSIDLPADYGKSPIVQELLNTNTQLIDVPVVEILPQEPTPTPYAINQPSPTPTATVWTPPTPPHPQTAEHSITPQPLNTPTPPPVSKITPTPVPSLQNPQPATERRYLENRAVITSPLYDTLFPTPPCLEGSVRFWELVYHDIDNNNVLFYDRAFVGRLYGIARIPPNERKTKIPQYEAYFKNKLQELYEALKNHQPIPPHLIPYAKLFPHGLLTPTNIQNAIQNVRSQPGVRQGFVAGIERSLQYLPMIFNILRQENVPLELSYLPHVESSFNPYAVSPVGAVGLWQIMPETMKLLMGKQAVSQRTNPLIATYAAARLLKQNYQAAGNWPLAITAYNHGMGGIERAVRSTGSRDICTILARYKGPGFGFASSNFYAQFLAARNVARSYYWELRKHPNIEPLLRPLWTQTRTAQK